MEVWSTAFLTAPMEDSSLLCFVEPHVWRRIQEENEGTRMFARLQAGDTSWVCALGAPVQMDTRGNGEADRIFLPFWMLEQIGLEGVGEILPVTWLTQEALPEATKIHIRPHDSAFYHVTDAKAELEQLLTRIGVIQFGSSIRLPLPTLGGYEVTFDVTLTEPANLVLMQGDEVGIEFEEALDAAAMAAVAATDSPVEETKETKETKEADQPFEDASMIPTVPTVPVTPAGHVLGGTTKPRLADGRAWNPWRDAPKAKA